jgi:hypothetical protein
VNKIHKQLSLFIIPGILLVFIVLLNTNKTLAINASDNNNSTAMLKFAKLQAFRGCLSNGTIKTKDIADKDTDLFTSSQSVSVGYLIDPDNGNRECNNMTGALLGSIGLNRDEFLLKYYEREDKSNSSSKWVLQDGVDITKKLRDLVDDEIGTSQINKMTIYSNMKLHFEKCYKTKTNDNGTSPITIVDMATGEPKKVYLSSNNDLDPDDTVGVGYGMPFDDQEDGEYSCQELANYMNNSGVNDTISNIVKELAKQGVKVTETTAGSTGSVSSTDDSCESKGGSLSWMACPLLDMLDSAAATLDSYVQQFLEVDIKDSGREKLQDAWKVMRTFAYILLVPIMLIMVIGTATGSQFIDAYTVKKAFPRMVAAVIFIALSWFLCMELINLTNVVGTGIRGIILNPFNVPNPTLSGILAEAGAVGGTSGGAAVAGGLALGAGAFVAGAASLGIIASTLFSAAIVMGIAFILLIARQVVIMGLVIAAPLAILSWIFPGNDKLWKFWWGAFSKLLFLFPVIMAMIAMGTAFASIVKDVVQ